MKNTLILTIFIILSIVNCNFPEAKKPQLERDWSLIESDLKNVSNFQNVGLNCRTFSSGDKVIHSLNVSLINGKNLPESDDQLKDIAKNALKIAINSISNEEEYHRFITIFITKNDGGIVKTNKAVPFEFKLEELKN